LNDNRIDSLEQRVQKLELMFERQDGNHNVLNQKLDTIIDKQDCMDNKYANRGIYEVEYKNLSAATTRINEKINEHLKTHYTKIDRFATWLSTALIGTFIIAKLGGWL
jgi:chromosome segregation ATPase